LRKNFRTDFHEIFREGWQWADENKWLNFCIDPDRHLDKGIVFRIRQYREIRKVVSTNCTA